MVDPVRVPPPLPPYPPQKRTTPPPLPQCPVCQTCQPDDWPVIFQGLATRQQERIRKANERYRFAESFLFPDERKQAQRFLADLESGLQRFVDLVLNQNSYIDFGSGKVPLISGATGKAEAIIAFITSTDRAAADFERFINTISSPEGVKSKCEKLPAGKCMSPCRSDKRWLRDARCTY